jgi:hypothetical protein
VVRLLELDLWASDLRYAGRSLGPQRCPPGGRSRLGSIKDGHGRHILERVKRGRTQREIADALGCSRSTFFNALHRLNGASATGSARIMLAG